MTMLSDFFRKIAYKASSFVKQTFARLPKTKNPDSETSSLLNDPEFLSILEQAKAQKGKGGVSEKELRNLLEVKSSQDS